MSNEISTLNLNCKTKSPVEILKYLNDYFSGSIVMASSLGAEDQVITSMIHENKLDIPIFGGLNTN